ncbi:hypothetical protein ACFU5O_04665 [Streptomyces sp. NPDC057445]|uniref:hypothetical protein n=1 Tax=Streptomyces sp. NPDC057445 TaxID=3346136 RepID=UPI0036A77A4E
MALTYSQVKQANLTPLSEALTKWKTLPGALEEISRTFGSTVTKNLRESDWIGEAAQEAFSTFFTVEREFYRAAEEAKDVHGLLSNAYGQLKSAQIRLSDVETAVAEDKYLKISPEGSVFVSVPSGQTEHAAALQKSYLETVHYYNDAVKRAVADASEADEALHFALSQDHNGRKRGFDSETASSVDEAMAQRKSAERDAKAATELAFAAISGKELTAAQLARVNRILASHEGDPYFSEKFAVTLGPRGTVNFWQAVADKQQTDEKEVEALRDLQKSLGHTLATATHSDSAAMQGWKDGMALIGPERIKDINYRAGIQSEGPYSFQVMGSLLRYGEYDTNFLKDYGKELISFERDFKGKAEDLWRPDGAAYYLNIGGTDMGQDPMAGYMEALGHNPEAAKQVFSSTDWAEYDPGKPPEEQMDADLKYLLTGREWPKDSVLGKDSDLGYGYDELGHALEAATLGVSYDQPDLGARRDASTVNVMEQVTSIVSKDTDFIKDKPGVGDSLARMGAGYIDDLNWSLAHEGGAVGSANPDAVFKHSGPNHMSMDEPSARKFMQIVGQYDGSYQVLSSAQQAFTNSAMVAYPDDLEKVRTAVNVGAYAHGILDEARISDVNEFYKGEEDKANLEYEKSAAWKQFGMSSALSIGAGIAVTPFLGPTAGIATATLVPMLVDTGTAAIETYWGNEYSEEALEKEADFSSKASLNAEDFEQLGKVRAQSPLLNYMELHQVDPGLRTTYGQEALNAYDRGANSADRTDGNK